MSSSRSGAMSPAVDVPSAYAKKALFGSSLGYAMDGFDLLILGFMLGAIRNEHGSHNPQETMALDDFLKGADLLYHTVVEAA